MRDLLSSIILQEVMLLFGLVMLFHEFCPEGMVMLFGELALLNCESVLP
jgi:hypothetical protein